MAGMWNQTGFSLIELMIVVAIVGIIGAVAYPSYVEQIRQSKRTDAQIALQQLAQRQESYFVRNYAYAANLTVLGYGANTIDSPEGEYDITLSAATASTYTLSATPDSLSGQAHDKTCSSFTLDHMGRKASKDNNNTVTTDKCWR